MSFRRISAVAGIASVVLFVGSFVAYGSVPSFDASASEIISYAEDNAGYALANALGAVGGLLMLVFVIGLAVPFGRSDREHGEGFGVVMVASAVVAATAIGLASALLSVLSNRTVDEAAVWPLWDGGNSLFTVAILSFFLGSGAAAIAVFRRGVMARWFGWLSAIVAVTGLTGLIPFFAGGSAFISVLVGYLGFLIWTLVGGIVLLRSES